MKSRWIIHDNPICFMGPGDRRSRRRFRCTPFRISTSPRSFEAPENVTSFMGKIMGLSENVVYPYTQWLMIIIPIKWLFHWKYTQHFQTNPYGKMSIESMFHWEPIFIAPSAKIMSQINHDLIPGVSPTGDQPVGPS